MTEKIAAEPADLKGSHDARTRSGRLVKPVDARTIEVKSPADGCKAPLIRLTSVVLPGRWGRSRGAVAGGQRKVDVGCYREAAE